ncbi:hypothetical protein Daus18300_002476 [Diaporthe australafricana]|uniref:Aflatoxin regulatory protein domain-containing protein n=1 Tax=Diaporthe australafricana TaxID=127596 RepID=A0ABR3XPG2_9PEZI
MRSQGLGPLEILDSVGDNYLVTNQPSSSTEDSAMSATLWGSSPTQAQNSINYAHAFFNFTEPPLASDLDFLGEFHKHEHAGSVTYLPANSAQGSSPDAAAPLPTPETHRCVQTLLRILQGLHTAPGGIGRGPDSDGILKANSAALQGLEQMLSQSASCDACMANSNLDFLLYTAGARMLSWYRAVFTCLQPSSATPETMTPTESVYFRPVQLSDFDLDTRSERRINSMLLLFELQKLARFLARLSDERFWGRDGRQESPAASPAGSSSVFRLEQNVLEAFDQFLTASVQELIQSVETSTKAE